MGSERDVTFQDTLDCEQCFAALAYRVHGSAVSFLSCECGLHIADYTDPQYAMSDMHTSEASQNCGCLGTCGPATSTANDLPDHTTTSATTTTTTTTTNTPTSNASEPPSSTVLAPLQANRQPTTDTDMDTAALSLTPPLPTLGREQSQSPLLPLPSQTLPSSPNESLALGQTDDVMTDMSTLDLSASASHEPSEQQQLYPVGVQWTCEECLIINAADEQKVMIGG